MAIRVLAHEKTKLTVELVGEMHTLPHLLSKTLWEDKEVTVSGYHVRHPQVGHAVLFVETTKKDPKKVLLETIGTLKKRSAEFKSRFKKIV